MKRLLFISLLLCVATSAYARDQYDFTFQGVAYKINLDGKTVSVTYFGNLPYDAYDNDLAYQGDVTIQDSVVYNEIYYTVTSVGDYAFMQCSQLNSVTLPPTVKSIGTASFEQCSVGSLTLDYIESVGRGAFGYASPNNGIINLPSITHLEATAFASCGLVELTLGDGLTSIPENAFCDCMNLERVKLPAGITAIGNSAFSNTNISSLQLPDSLVTIGDNAFSGAPITWVNIPKKVTSIGRFAFCQVLEGFAPATSGWSVLYDAQDCKTIGMHAFCPAVKSLTIGPDVEVLPANMPPVNNVTEAITIPDNVKTIKATAFVKPSDLDGFSYTVSCRGAVFGSGIENIEQGAFGDYVTNAYCTTATPPNSAARAFSKPNKLKVPAGSRAAYWTATGWNEFTTIEENDNVFTPVTLTLSDTLLVMSKEEQHKIVATLVPTDEFPGYSISWSSSNSNVATVTSDGTVKAIANGEAIVTASFVDTDLTASCRIVVTDAKITAIAVEPTAISMLKDKTADITVGVSPATADDSEWDFAVEQEGTVIAVRKLNGNLSVLAVEKGTATITVFSVLQPQIKAQCTINVIFPDVNGDQQVTTADVTAIYDILTGVSTEFISGADTNGDGQVTVSDVTTVYNAILGAE